MRTKARLAKQGLQNREKSTCTSVWDIWWTQQSKWLRKGRSRVLSWAQVMMIFKETWLFSKWEQVGPSIGFFRWNPRNKYRLMSINASLLLVHQSLRLSVSLRLIQKICSGLVSLLAIAWSLRTCLLQYCVTILHGQSWLWSKGKSRMRLWSFRICSPCRAEVYLYFSIMVLFQNEAFLWQDLT